MKYKKTCYSTRLDELYGRDKYQPYITVNRQYWWHFPNSFNDISSGWHKIRITYIRSGCAFYIVCDTLECIEHFFQSTVLWQQHLLMQILIL